jgi:O-antigen/teichoic acid export membrane protein
MANSVTISTPEHRRSALDRRLVSAVAWTAAAKFGTQIITWSCLLLLARLLSPSDFGLVSMSSILIGFINIFAEFGIGSAILVMRELTKNQIRQIHSVSVILGFCISGLTTLAAKPAAAFFHKTELLIVIPVMGLAFIISGFRVVPQALLARDLRFKAISLIEAQTAVIQSLASLPMAWLGMRYWALVIGSLAAAAFACIRFSLVSPCGFARPMFRQLREQLAYSQRILVSRAAWYGYSNADFTVGGRILGESVLGVYTLAWNLANSPVDRIVTLILRVTPSVFSTVQHDTSEMRRYLRVLTEGMALVLFPVGFGIALVADVAVPAFFDKRWAGAAMPLRMLAICAVIRCLVSVASQVQETIRDVRYAMWQSLACLVVLPAAFWYATRWGGTGIAAAWLLFYPIVSAPALLRTLHKIDMSQLEYVRSFRPAAVATIVMAAAVLFVRHSVHEVRPLVQLIVDSLTGAAIYMGVLVLFFRSRLSTFLGLVRQRKSVGYENETAFQATT